MSNIVLSYMIKVDLELLCLIDSFAAVHDSNVLQTLPWEVVLISIVSVKLFYSKLLVKSHYSTAGDGDQLPKALEVFSEMKRMGLCPNTITYSILLVASEK